MNNAAAVGSLFSTCHMFHKILFDYLKAYDQISPESEMGLLQNLLIMDIPLYDLPNIFLSSHSAISGKLEGQGLWTNLS